MSSNDFVPDGNLDGTVQLFRTGNGVVGFFGLLLDRVNKCELQVVVDDGEGVAHTSFSESLANAGATSTEEGTESEGVALLTVRVEQPLVVGQARVEAIRLEAGRFRPLDWVVLN